MNQLNELLDKVIQSQPYPLLFTTISGAHLYGFPSADSDYDLRGVHLLPLTKIVGLYGVEETIELSEVKENVQIDLVTHELKKFCLLLLKNNGYVLEQLYSPLIVYSTPEHEELKAIAKACITRFHSYHYVGFAKNQWQLLTKSTVPKVKPLLYLYRVLLTGIYLMQTGRIEANLVNLNQEFKLPLIADLIKQKTEGEEQSTLKEIDLDFHQREYQRLQNALAIATQASHLPEESSAKEALNQFLVHLRTI
jgi:uncharacterized protein